MRGLMFALALMAPSVTTAQLINPASSVDAGARDQAAAAASAVSAIQAGLPKPATMIPPAEVAGGTAGTMTTSFALANHSHPRITDSPTVYTATGGTFSGSFRAGLFTAKPTVTISWVVTGSLGAVSCEFRTLTATAFTGRCTALLGLVPAGAGIEVDVIALPNTASQ